MKLHYYPETDSLYIELSERDAGVTREIVSGVNIDVAEDGTLVGIDIDAASTRADLTTLETAALPLRNLRAA